MLVLLLVAASLPGWAQVEQGKILLFGGLGFSSSTPENENASKSSGFSFAPGAGYFISNSFAVGLNVNVSSDRQENQSGDFKSNGLSFGAFARWYKPLGDESKFYFFAQPGISFGSVKEEFEGFESKSSSFSIGASPGFAFYPSNRVGIELSFSGISYTSQNPEGDNNNRSFFNFGASSLSPSLGVTFLLN